MYVVPLILYIYIINIQIIYSHRINNILFYTYENITDYINYINSNNQLYLSRYVHIYDKNQTLKKTEVLEIKNKFNINYFCKNNICVKVDWNILPKSVEIPDKNGNIKRYISESYTYDNLKSGDYGRIIYDDYNIYISYKCTSDSQCLTNKCIDGVCIFNEENPTEFCTDIYINLIFRFSYMHCGKAIGDICKKDKECGSKNCMTQNVCGNSPDGPSDSDFITGFINLIHLFAIMFIIFCISYCIKLILKHKIKINTFYLFILLFYFYVYFYIF